MASDQTASDSQDPADGDGEMDSRCGSEVSGSDSISMQRSQRLYQQFLTDAAAYLSFSPDTGSVSFNQSDFQHLFRLSGALKPSAKGKTQEGKRCRPAQRPPERCRGLQESEEQTPIQLQTAQACSRTRLTAGHCPKRASGLPRPVQEDQIILQKSLKYHKDMQRWSSRAPQRGTGPDNKSLKTDRADPVEPVQTEVLPTCSRPTSPQSGLDPDSWLAAQRSALDGDYSHGVIRRLVAQLFLCRDEQPDSEEQADDSQLVVPLLSFISSQTTLVRSLLAEKLNSSDWRDRLISCSTLRSLKGPLNKDVVQKLSDLMCSDHSDTVRLAAAETLMKLGKTHQVHTELRLKFEEGQGLQGRMEALDLIGHLKLTTAMLLEPLVGCLGDEFTAVRTQACLTAASLLLKDDTVVRRLLQVIENDTARDVRLSAIRAVDALGLSSLDVQETLLRCVETEEEAELRLAACRLLLSARVPSAQLQDFLLRRINVESDWLVRRTMKEMLCLCDGGQQEDLCPTHSVSRQVKRLCERRVITEKLLLLEKLQAGGTRRLGRGTLARLLSQQYKMGSPETADRDK
ncbi:HEAT repeat-containing protein 4 isoform X2 [Sander lucioperca]|uniref:HEAT repeat-containing protein 4 isoform X2 n=1 Tax=Sander lucioperca TaxID=283035 RepID=UPI0016537D57|nr:HEAT repeat-containing protein 4 isoform X2 [Sander lucioperca]